MPNYKIAKEVVECLSFIVDVDFDISSIPDKPGVYIIKALDHILYIGKAKNLKNRVSSYGHKNLSYRVDHFISQASEIELLITRSEKDALILENKLIFELKPKYNIRHRDKHTYPFIAFTDHKYPRLITYNGYVKTTHKYGPFISYTAISNQLQAIQKAFRLRSCNDYTFQTKSRPCLLYFIHKCSAPCVGKVTEEQYMQQIRDANAALSLYRKHVIVDMRNEMMEKSKSLDFERAAILRDRIAVISGMYSNNLYYTSDAKIRDFDILIKAITDRNVYVQCLKFRGGNYVDSNLLNTINDDCIADFYSKYNDLSMLILTNVEDLVIAGVKKAQIIYPKKGYKKALLISAIHNLKSFSENFELHTSKQKSIKLEVIEFLQSYFKVHKDIDSKILIECYDNSHMQGENAFACMVVHDGDKFLGKKFLKLPITYNTSDDYSMFEQILRLRFRDNKREMPDLLIIDGGLSHNNFVQKILYMQNIQVPVVCICKGDHRRHSNDSFYILGRKAVLSDAMRRFFQTIRDKAHSVAINSHRSNRDNIDTYKDNEV